MKRPILLITIIVLSTFEAKAGIKLKVLGILTETSARYLTDDGETFSASENTGKAYGIGQGLSLDIAIGGPVSIEGGVYMQPRGYKWKTNGDQVKYDAMVKTLMVRFKAEGTAGSTKVPASFGLGVYVSNATSDDMSLTVSSETSTIGFSDTSHPLAAAMKKNDQGLVAATAIDIPLSKTIFFAFELRYLWGTQQILEDNASNRKAYFDEINTMFGLTFQF